MLKKILVLMMLISPISVNAKVIRGKSRVIDGDTIEIENRKVRLLCIDTPESNYRGKMQYCLDNETMCGELAKNALETMIGDKRVACEIEKIDLYGRDLGICYLSKDYHLSLTLSKHSLNYKLLEQGFAYYYPCSEYKDWKKVAEKAKQENLGLFNEDVGGFINPKLWRKNGGHN